MAKSGEPQNHAEREQKQGGEQELQTGRSNPPEQLRPRQRDTGKGERIKGEGDYGVAAGRRYDDQTTRRVYEEPERSKDR